MNLKEIVDSHIACSRTKERTMHIDLKCAPPEAVEQNFVCVHDDNEGQAVQTTTSSSIVPWKKGTF